MFFYKYTAETNKKMHRFTTVVFEKTLRKSNRKYIYEAIKDFRTHAEQHFDRFLYALLFS